MFRIPARESSVVWRLFAFSLTIATSYIVARTVGDSLFLSRIGNQQLALVFVIAGCVTAFVAGVWYFATRHLSISKTIQISGAVFAILGLGAWFLLPEFHHSFWLLAAIYLLAEIKGCINAINIVSALNTKLGRDASKPAWAAIGLAAPIAAVVAGGMFAIEYHSLSLRTWLLVGALLDIASCFFGVILGRTRAVGKTLAIAAPSKRPAKPILNPADDTLARSQRSYVCSNKFRFWIGVLITAKVIALTIVAFEWKSSVNTFFESNPEKLVQFFGTYYGVVGLVTIAIQVFLTSRLLVRRNWSLPILLMPFALAILAVSFVAGAGLLVALIAATTGKSLEAWRRSVHDTTLNLLYTRIKRDGRRSAISLNNGVIKPLAEVAASSVIFLGAAGFYRPFFLIVLGIWILAAMRLIRLVKTPRPSGNQNDASVHKILPESEPRVWRSNPIRV
jgi:ATP/ADP translocase